MNELLPSPNITSVDERGQMQQMKSYLFQLKEALEFILTNIGIDNLSVTLQEKLSAIGVSIEEAKTDADERQQATTKLVQDTKVSVTDVINSKLFQLEMENMKEYTDKAIEKENTRATSHTNRKIVEVRQYTDLEVSKTKKYADEILIQAKAYTDEQVAANHPTT